MHINYKKLINKTSTKPVNIYIGNEIIGVAQGYYKNIFLKIIDQFINNNKIPFIGYQLKDNKGKTRLVSKNATGWGLRKVSVKYIDKENQEYEFLMKDSKHDLIEKLNQVIFEFKGDKYYLVESKMFDMNGKYELICEENTIAEWTHGGFSYQVSINITDPDFFDDKYFIIGVFHSYLYPVS